MLLFSGHYVLVNPSVRILVQYFQLLFAAAFFPCYYFLCLWQDNREFRFLFRGGVATVRFTCLSFTICRRTVHADWSVKLKGDGFKCLLTADSVVLDKSALQILTAVCAFQTVFSFYLWTMILLAFVSFSAVKNISSFLNLMN